MIKLKWIVLGIGIVAIIIIGILFTVQSLEDVPRASVKVTINELGSENFWEGSINIDQTYAQSLFGHSVPMTSYIADVPALNPNGLYSISFQLTAIFDVDGSAKSSIVGNMGNGFPAYWDDKLDREKLNARANTTANQETVFIYETLQGEKTEYIWYKDGSVYYTIKGSNVDNSVFNMTIDATGYNVEGAWSVGHTDVTITINVGPMGDIVITITDIETIVTEL